MASAAPAPKPAPRGRKAFVRTEVPALERVASIVILGLLVVIGGAVWYKGLHFDPALYSLRSDALKSTASEVQGKGATARSGGSGEGGDTASKADAPKSAAAGPVEAASEPEPSESGGGSVTAQPHEQSVPATKAQPVKGEPMEPGLPGAKPMGDTEFYSAETLFEKIDGRAGAYLGFNCQGLRFRSFTAPDLKSSYVDVYEYRLDTPVNAFGIFALERDPKGKPVDFAPDGYAADMGLFFRQGVYYVQIIGSDLNAKTLELVQAIARNRARALPADDAGLNARRRLPATGLVAESVAFVPENAQGQDFLKNVFQANYQFEGAKLPFFLAVATPMEAAAGWKKFNAFCTRFGKATVLPEVNGAKVFQAESFGKFKVIYQKDGEIGGVYDATDLAKSVQFVEAYLKGKIK